LSIYGSYFAYALLVIIGDDYRQGQAIDTRPSGMVAKNLQFSAGLSANGDNRRGDCLRRRHCRHGQSDWQSWHKWQLLAQFPLTMAKVTMT
jgi:hypothetical protein